MSARTSLLSRAVLLVASTVASCAPVHGDWPEHGPSNDCAVSACATYAQEGVRPTCSAGRCVVFGQPRYPVTIVVHAPETNFYGAGTAFAVRIADLATTVSSPRCPSGACVRLPPLVEVRGEYRVTAAGAAGVSFPLALDPATLPVEVQLAPLLEGEGTVEPSTVGLPLFPKVEVSQLLERASATSLQLVHRAHVAPGRYLRVAYPAPPFEGAFPPIAQEIVVVADRVDPVAQRFIVSDPVVLDGGERTIDDPSGTSRTATFRRAGGLLGWHGFLRDMRTERRLSTLRALSGSEARVRLDTVGMSAPGTNALREGIEVVLRPPEGSVAAPELRSPLIAGQGLDVEYPALPHAGQISGKVVAGVAGGRARLRFRSRTVRELGGVDSVLLHYEASVGTDSEGAFTTVLPEGDYDVDVEPATPGYRRERGRLEVRGDATGVELLVRPQTLVRGRALLADGRALTHAEVFLAPVVSATEPWGPRPTRTTTSEDGSFAALVDVGRFDLTIAPQEGSGFGRAVLPARDVGEDPVDLGPVTVAAPLRVALVARDPGDNAVPRAVVQAFAFVGGRAVEIALALTDRDGRFELLLPPTPPS